MLSINFKKTNYMYFKKYNHTFEFTEHVSMFQTSSSAIVSVTIKFLQDNSYIYIYNYQYNDSLYIKCSLQVGKIETNQQYYREHN